MRPKAKFLTVVWGEAYITRFATLALPSFLAPGNLPALAEATELEVVIMTRRDDIAVFERHAAFLRLREISALRFVEIDDLITTLAYGVTLTLAYARAVIACGRDMLDTHFVFMNADFVLADGSLRALCKHILAGRSIVLGPSFRATAEAVEPALEAAADPATGILAIPPRRLAALSLPHPHPTTIAKTVNQGFCHSTHPNQFFWQVDAQTLLGRYYLIFMLCLKPERIIETINCFCDYAFIPEMCPSGDEAVMGDSDDFFMLELQKHDQELQLLRLDRQPEAEIARSLQVWTTAEHRRAASYDVVFHGGEVPAGIEAAKAEARAFVERIGRKLGTPVPHATHQYWMRGVEAWRQLRKAQGLPAMAPELAAAAALTLRDIPGRVAQGFWSLIYAGRHALLGLPPRVTLFHPDWMDFRHLRDTLAVLLEAPGARVLVVRDQPELVDCLVGPEAAVRFATVKEVLNGCPSPWGQGPDGHTHVLIYLVRKQSRFAQQLVERCQSAMGTVGTCQVFIHHHVDDRESADFSRELTRRLEEIIGSPPRATVCTFAGGALKDLSRRVFTLLYRLHEHFGVWALPWILLLMAIALPLALIGNLRLFVKSRNLRSDSSFCSSVAIRFGPVENTPRERAGG
jgi:hypothetical protein